MSKEFEPPPSSEQPLVSVQPSDGQQSAPQQKERFLIQAQYEQLHEMRREYNRVLFQAPTIVVTVAGASLAVLPFLLGANLTRTLGTAIGTILFISISGFVFVLGYWALRSRILLRAAEKTLKSLEQIHGHPDLIMYPYEVNSELPAWQRWPSSRLIVVYIFIIGVALFIVGLIVLLASL